MTKYRVVKAYGASALQIEVTELLNEGWELAGGVAIAQQFYNHDFVFTQAMIKEEPVDWGPRK